MALGSPTANFWTNPCCSIALMLHLPTEASKCWPYKDVSFRSQKDQNCWFSSNVGLQGRNAQPYPWLSYWSRYTVYVCAAGRGTTHRPCVPYGMGVPYSKCALRQGYPWIYKPGVWILSSIEDEGRLQPLRVSFLKIQITFLNKDVQTQGIPLVLTGENKLHKLHKVGKDTLRNYSIWNKKMTCWQLIFIKNTLWTF